MRVSIGVVLVHHVGDIVGPTRRFVGPGARLLAPGVGYAYLPPTASARNWFTKSGIARASGHLG